MAQRCNVCLGGEWVHLVEVNDEGDTKPEAQIVPGDADDFEPCDDCVPCPSCRAQAVELDVSKPATQKNDT